MTNTHYFKTLLTLAALIGMTACGGGGDSGSMPAPPPPAAPASFSFPVVATTTTPQGCVREDGKQGVSAVTYTQPNLAGSFDRVVLPCNSSSGQRIVRARAGSTPILHHIDAAGTVVASWGFTLFAMLPGSTQEIALSGTNLEAHEFIGVFNGRALYMTRDPVNSALVSVTISQTPTRTILHTVVGTMRVHNQLIGGRVFFATVTSQNPVTEYRSVQPDGTDLLLLRSVPGSSTSLAAAPLLVPLTLRDREVIYIEQMASPTVPTIRMVAIDTPGSDLLIAQAFLDQAALAVPGTTDRFVFLGRFVQDLTPVLAEVTAERGNLSIKTLRLSATSSLLGFSQGRLYARESVGFGPFQPLANVAWLGEGNTAPRTVLTALYTAYWVTDRAIVFTRAFPGTDHIIYSRSDLDGTNERAGSPASTVFPALPALAGERIYYPREALTINNDVATLDLVTGVETVAYRPNPVQDQIRFFRVGGRLIVWRPAIGADPGWIDSVDLDGNDLRRLAQSPDILEAKPF